MNAPVGTNMAASVNTGRQLVREFRNISRCPQAMPIVPQIRIERRLNFCVSQKAMTVQSVIQPSM